MNYKYNVRDAENARLIRRFHDYLAAFSANKKPGGILVEDGECAFVFYEPIPQEAETSTQDFAVATLVWKALIGFGRMKIGRQASTGDYTLIMVLSLSSIYPERIVYGGNRIEYHYSLDALPKIASAIIDFPSQKYPMSSYRKFDDTWKSFLRMSREAAGEALSPFSK